MALKKYKIIKYRKRKSVHNFKVIMTPYWEYQFRLMFRGWDK